MNNLGDRDLGHKGNKRLYMQVPTVAVIPHQSQKAGDTRKAGLQPKGKACEWTRSGTEYVYCAY